MERVDQRIVRQGSLKEVENAILQDGDTPDVIVWSLNMAIDRLSTIRNKNVTILP